MITPMLKYNFLLYHEDMTDFLTHLQELGVVDISSYAIDIDDGTRELISLSNKYDTAYKGLKAIKINENTEAFYGLPESALEIYETARQEKIQLDAQIKKIEKDVDETLPWGNFNALDIERLQNMGITPRFYVIAERSFHDKWKEQYTLEEISHDNGKIYFVILQETGSDWNFDLQETKLPQSSYEQLLSDLKELNTTYSNYQTILEGLAKSADIFLDEKKCLVELINFRTAQLAVRDETEGKVKILSGWVPETQNENLLKFLDEKSVFYFAEENPEDEAPPILLKNSRYAKLFEPITRLYSLPEYKELDLTPLFAPFFMLFFGFCLGDGGYGIVLFLLASVLKLKIKNPSFRPYLSLTQWLGAATVLFGIITGTFFGITLESLNFVERAENLFGLPKSYGMLALSIVVGFIQVIFGMCVNVANIVRQFGWKYAFSKIAWILIILLGIVYLAFGESLGNLNYIILASLGLSALVALFYNTPGKNPFLNFGKGLWHTYNTASGLLGDLLSYIRLFALGMTGGILGSVFNQLATELSGNIPVLSTIFMILILLFGHGLNILINTLGAVVHPMRLTFVEFYKNAGFAGGGRPYKAFKKEN